MLKFEKFSGIDNVAQAHRLTKDQLTVAENVDIGLSGEIFRRGGYSSASAVCHKNVWQGSGFVLATTDGGDLAVTTGATQTVLYASLGIARVWYCNLPDGRTTFSNGLINGITDGAVTTKWGVPIPPGIGAVTDVAGSLHPGSYQYQVTHVRSADGLEGPPAYSNPVPLPSGGIVLTGLPVLAGHTTNVYITGRDGGTGYYAGNTANALFSFTGTNEQLVLPCRTEFLDAMPVGTVTAFWRGRTLVAVGPTLYASQPSQWELCDMRKNFKQFSGDITLIQPVDGGIFVGTTKELAFLAGTEFDKLSYEPKVTGNVVLGSGVSVRGELIKQREGAALGTAMICIADGVLTAGYSDGGVVRMTEGRYETTATEVAATFRMINRIPQYIATPQ